jgi:alpha-L-rhamnosidase
MPVTSLAEPKVSKHNNKLMHTKTLSLSGIFFALCFSAGLETGVAASLPKPVSLQCDSLVEPLGIDNQKPLLSWQLQDARWGAVQTAYQIQIASKPDLLASGQADVWDSGRVLSGQSVNVPYGGGPLAPQKRYYWLVRAWDMHGHLYPASDVSWWETGLLTESNWTAKRIGYEQAEHRRIRESGAAWVTNPEVPNFNGTRDTQHDFRLRFDVTKPVKRAVLYVTGQDTAAAWINGRPVLEAQPLPRWRQMPWQTYSHKDISAEVQAGSNLLGIGITHYFVQSATTAAPESRTPMSACIYIESADGSVTLFASSAQGWKASLNPEGDWFTPGYDDSSWGQAEVFTPRTALGGNLLGNPWPTGPVMILRHGFQLAKPVVSARLYATALGAYKFHLNGGVVGDQILSPGWMDFRQHVPYQVYDVTTQVKAGRNAIAAYLAPGWYTTPLMWFRQGYNYGNTPPALKAQLRLEYADGSVDWVATDESWKAGVSPILSAEIYDGETYDARQVQPGWDTATFSDANWSEAKIITPTEPEIVSQYFQPIREEKVMTAHREHFLRPISHGFSRQNISQMKYGSQYPTRGKSPRAGGLALTRHFPRCGRKPLNQPDFAASTKLGTANAHLNHDADV